MPLKSGLTVIHVITTLRSPCGMSRLSVCLSVCLSVTLHATQTVELFGNIFALYAETPTFCIKILEKKNKGVLGDRAS